MLFRMLKLPEHPVTSDLYGHAATADLSTAQSWCQTGIGFTPTMYAITSGHLMIH